VPVDSSERNDTPAMRILFRHPPFSAAVLYPMPAADVFTGMI